MSTKRNPGRFDCYAKAETDEPYFTLLGRDRHASALVRLWAEMREKEGEEAAVVEEARQVAGDMAAYAQAKAKPVVSLQALIALITSSFARKGPRPAPPHQPRPQFRPAVEDYVITVRGNEIGIVTKLFTEKELPRIKGGEIDPKQRHLLDSVMVQFGRAEGPVNVMLQNLRKPTEEELARAGYE